MENIVNFLDKHKYKILILLLLILLWRIFSQNLFLIALVIIFAYFVYTEYNLEHKI